MADATAAPPHPRNSVRHWRLHNRMTQATLAARTGVARHTIMNVEHGRTVPSVFLAIRLAAVLCVSVTILFPDGEA